MRPTLTRPSRRRRTSDGSSAPRLPKGKPGTTTSATGGPVGPSAEYVSRRTRRSVSGSARGSGSTLFPRRRSAPLVRRTVFAVLILASLGLISATYRGGVVLHGAQLAVLDVVSPIERGLSRAWDPVAGAWNWGGRVITAANENPRLEAENAELRESLRIAVAQEDEIKDLRTAGYWDDTFRYPGGYTRVRARVHVRYPGAVERNIVIDKGSNDGIAVDDPVMVVGGLLGRVDRVSDDTSIVALIINDAQQVTASVVGEGEATGILRTTSTEGAPVMNLLYIPQNVKVDSGDEVVTSGFRSGTLESLYPEGIPIGEVTNSGNDPADDDKTVQVKPYADFDHIEELFVLVPEGRG